jgi:UDP-glucose 4-epimerase
MVRDIEHHWVIGRGGMLGSSLEKVIRMSDEDCVILTSVKIEWESLERASQNIRRGVEEFARISANAPWCLYWCAGTGTVVSDAQMVSNEVFLVAELVLALKEQFGERVKNGRVFFASSAGGIYAGCRNAPMTEDSPVNPINAYGEQKLHIENLLISFAKQDGAKVLIGRIANLYGINQNKFKGQGLITAICQSTLLRRPISIYVGLETVRNYIDVDDAVVCIARSMQLLARRDYGVLETKIVSSLFNHSISTVLKESEAVFGKRLQVSISRTNEKSLHPIDLSLNSINLQEADQFEHSSLLAGIDKVRIGLLKELQSSNLKFR